jgi:hypothetical protein
MSLKIMHIVLVIMSILLSAFLSYSMYNTGDSHYATLLATIGTTAVVSLTIYLSVILKKFKTI